jgi:cold shock CspA family protein
VTGTVKWFNTQLGYGFIEMLPADKLTFGIEPEVDLFVHARVITGKFPRTLSPGQRVTFDVLRTFKSGAWGWEAHNVIAETKAEIGKAESRNPVPL